jgi:hypothetical protein
MSEEAAKPVLAGTILSVVDQLRKLGPFEQFPDLLGGRVFGRDGKEHDTPRRPGWLPADYTPATGGPGFCDTIMRAAWSRGLLEGGDAVEGGRRRLVLKPDTAIAPIVEQLEQEWAQDKARARAAGLFVSD